MSEDHNSYSSTKVSTTTASKADTAPKTVGNFIIGRSFKIKYYQVTNWAEGLSEQ